MLTPTRIALLLLAAPDGDGHHDYRPASLSD